MISVQRINLKDKETGWFLTEISSEEITFDEDRKCAKDFEWYSWFYYKIFIKFVFGRVVNRSTIINVIGGND